MSNLAERGEQLSSSQQVLLALKEARAKLEDLENSKTESIAIIGMGCRFPAGASDPATVWQLLRDGVDAITEVPPDRWDVSAYYDPDPEAPGMKIYTRYGGFVKQVDRFDPQFFGISPREAVSMDPQHRLLLEVSWETLENAGQSPAQLRCSQTGVFIGISTDDYAQLRINSGNLTRIDAYSSLGTTRSIAVGRLAYVLGLQGPTIQLDTACSSSLVAVHLACQSLRSGECNLALAGGVNLILSPLSTISRCKLKALSPDGHCKTFDASANGYVQGEGCGVVVLKRLSEAVADGDNILALIRGSAVNNDGPSSGLMVPSELAQEELIRQALRNAKVEPAQVSYVEAHGTGTSLGDPIEVGALGAVFGKDRPQDQPLVIGSVKTNFGHLEAAAGIASLIKVVLALQHKEIPPHLHFKQPNSHISWDELPVVVPTERKPWPSGERRRLAGVSSFGISGTNAHVVVEEAPVPELLKAEVERPLHLLTLSAKTEEALKQLASRYENHLTANPDLPIENICFTANTGRAHFTHRLSVVASSSAEVCEKLAVFTAGQEPAGVFRGRVQSTSQPKIAFLFTGQGSQYIGMGHQLYETQPTFQQALDRCDEILRPYLEKPLIEVLYPEARISSPLDETAYTQPALFALEYALFQLWKSWGIEPAVVMGHSVGEYIAACVAGVFSLEDGLKLIAERGGLMQALPQDGEMVAVFADEDKVQAAIQPYAQEVAIAAINSPQNIVISGKRDCVEAANAALQAQGVETKKLKVSHAFHSPLMEPMLAAFERVAKDITYSSPQIDLISNVTGKLANAEIATPEYWLSHVRQSVRFAAGMETLHQQGYEVFVEIGSKPTLLGMGHYCLPEVETGNFAFLPSLRQGQSDWQQILQSLGALYVRGVPVDWFGFERDYPRRRVVLPTYPFQRQRYWLETAENRDQKAGVLSQEHVQTPILNLLNQGDTKQLAQQLEKAGNFSEAQMKFLPELLEVLVRQHQQQLMAASIKDWLYKIEWQPKPRQLKTGLEGIQFPESGSWLILADRGGVGQTLAKLLQEHGQNCVLVYPGYAYKSLETGVWSLNPASPEDFQRLFQEAWVMSEPPLKGLVHLWSLEATLPDELTIPSLEQAQTLGCGSGLHLVQALVKHNGPASPRLWLVTRGAMPVGHSFPAVAQAPLWGLGKVVALEHPELWGGMLDLAPEVSLDDEAATLLAEIWDSEGEDHLAFRNGQRYVARLVASSRPEPQGVQLQSDSTYLITGGLGALGLKLAQWMVEQGVRHLVLTGRSGASSQAQETITHMEQAGAQVLVAKADVSNQGDMARVFEEVNTSMPPLRGIVHAAGVPGYQAIEDMELNALESVLRPKVVGTWILHQLTQEMKLDFFVSFSSIASVWGSKGQAHYTAANHFLDVLAHYRRGLGLPALSVNWGPWAGGGMAATKFQTWLTQMGVKALPAEQAVEALGYLLGAGCVQTTVANVDWAIFKGFYEARGQRPLLKEISAQLREAAEQQSVQRSETLQRLEEAQASDRQEFLVAYVQEHVTKVLELDSSLTLDLQQSLLELAIDSLMAIQLKNRIETDLMVDVPIEKFINGSSILQLAKLLLEQLALVNTMPSVPPSPNLSDDWEIIKL